MAGPPSSGSQLLKDLRINNDVKTYPLNPVGHSVSAWTSEVQVNDYNCQECWYRDHDHVETVVGAYKKRTLTY